MKTIWMYEGYVKTQSDSRKRMEETWIWKCSKCGHTVRRPWGNVNMPKCECQNCHGGKAVLVENMEMPESCGKCRMYVEGCGFMYCAAATDVTAISAKAVDRDDIRQEWCPLKEV